MNVASLRSGLAGALLLGSLLTSSAAHADGTHKELRGCISARTDTTITLKTSGDETVDVDTTWLKPSFRDTLTAECVIVEANLVDGKLMAESVEVDDDSTNHANRQDRDKEEDDHDSGHNDD